MKILSAALGFALVIGLVGCNSSQQEKAREQAREDLRKSSEEAKKAGNEIKKDAKELSQRVDAVTKRDSVSPSQKLSYTEARAKEAASHAGVKLDQAALLAEVKTKLISDAGLSTLGTVDVTVAGSVVTLSGTVASENQRKAAEMAASQVDGVTRVQNRLTVQP